MLKLYYAPGACSLAPHIILEESQLAFSIVRVDLKAKVDELGQDYRQINPKGSVPAIQIEDGQILTEAAVVLQYIADHSKVPLMPPPASWERYRCLEWLNYIATELHKGFGPLWNPATPEDYKKIAIKNLAARFDYLNAHLANNDYLLGSNFAIPDAYLFTVLNWSAIFKIDLSPWPSLQKFIERVRQRPATIAALKAEKLI